MILTVLFKLWTTIKLYGIKLWCNLIIFSWHDMDVIERSKGLGRAMLFFGPLAFITESLELWYIENTSFTLFACGFVLANAVIGGIVHKMNGKFNWEALLVKTMKMVLIVSGVYIILEGIVSPIGENAITEAFIAAFQVATLLYPGAKILKNFFIWSDGEHPPKYIMERIFNFKENGDLKQFLSRTPENVEDFTD